MGVSNGIDWLSCSLTSGKGADLNTEKITATKRSVVARGSRAAFARVA